MISRHLDWDEPCYVISIAARIVGLNAQTLRYYERTGLLEPGRSGGNIRLYSLGDIERLRRIKTLINDLGVNLAGVEVILRLTDQIEEMRNKLDVLMHRMEKLQQGSD